MAGALLAVGLAVPAPPEQTAGFRLVDPSGNPYSGVDVSVVGRAGAVTTDREGRFRFLLEPSPPYDLAVFDARGALIGVVRVLSVDAPEDRVLTLAVAPREEVTVLSGAAPASLAPPAAAASMLSSVENQERRPASLVEALTEIPGAGQVGSGQTAVPSLRGLARGRTLILLDGARVSAERRAGPSATFLDPFSLESLEIIRGPGAVAYGSDALGGVIHARTPMPRPGGFDGRYEVSGGLGEELASAAFEVNVPVGSGAVLGQGHLRTVDDYRSPAGTVPNSRSRDRGLLLRGLIPSGERRMLLGLQLDRVRDTGKPGTPTVYPTEDSDRLTFGTDLPVFGGLSELDLEAFLGRYRLVTDRVSDGSIERSDVESDDASLRLVGTRQIGRGSLRLGIDLFGRFNLQARNLMLARLPGEPPVPVTEEDSIESARRFNSGLFAEAEFSLPSIRGSLAAGLRGDRVETSNSGGSFGDRSTSNGSVSGYLAMTYHPAKEWSASLQYARGFRDPGLSDRYFEGVTGRGRIVGNPDLRPETSDQLDLAVRAKAGPVRIAGYAYLYRIKDLVERFPVEVPPGEVPLFNFTNRGNVEIRGIELESDVHLAPGLDLRLTANFAEGEIRDDGSPAADIPSESLGVALRSRGDRHWWRIDLLMMARDRDAGRTEDELPGYSLVDLAVGFDLGSGLEIRALLGNLFDRAFPDSPDEGAPPAPGRSLALVLAGRF